MVEKKHIDLSALIPDSTAMTPEALLTEVLNLIEDGTITPNGIVILAVDADLDEWRQKTFAAGLSTPEKVTSLEFAKLIEVQSMIDRGKN